MAHFFTGINKKMIRKPIYYTLPHEKVYFQVPGPHQQSHPAKVLQPRS